MDVEFSDEALKDLKYWRKVKNKKVQERISALIEVIRITPFDGIGNPEGLKHELTGYWSRRINKEHRIVYLPLIEENKVIIISLRFHY